MGALPSCNYYDPFVWQASDGRYYVPAIAYAGTGPSPQRAQRQQHLDARAELSARRRRSSPRRRIW